AEHPAVRDEPGLERFLERSKLGDPARLDELPELLPRSQARFPGAHGRVRSGRAPRPVPATSGRAPPPACTREPQRCSCPRARAALRRARADRRSGRSWDRRARRNAARNDLGYRKGCTERRRSDSCRAGVASSVPLPWGGLGSVRRSSREQLVSPTAVLEYRTDMPRAIWSGSIAFGLVNAPVKM